MRIIDADKLKEQVCLDKFEKITHSPERRMVTFDEVLVFIDTYASSIETKQIKYFDEDEKVWKIGEVIVDE